MQCFTIHKALEYEGGVGFAIDKYNKLEQKIIACDEGSMIDIELGYSLVQAINTGSKLFILGDTKQLPSIGAGNVLGDMINSGLVKVVTLDVIKRQGSLSGIIENATKVINSEMISTSSKKDFFVLERNTISDVQI